MDIYDEIEQMGDQLRKRGVSDAVVSELELITHILTGSFYAEAWDNPKLEMRFLALQLEACAKLLREMEP